MTHLPPDRGPVAPPHRLPAFGPALAGLLGMLALLWAPAASAGHELINKVYDPLKTKTEIRVSALASELAPSGYMAVRVYIKNATKIPRTWRLDFTSTDSNYGSDGSEMSSDFTLSCPSKQVKTFELLVPLVTAFVSDYDNSTELIVRASSPGFQSLTGSMATSYTFEWPSVLISAELNQYNGSLLQTEVASSLSSSHGSPGSIQFGGSFDPDDMSSDWRAYCGYDFCLLTDEDWKKMGPGPQSALLRWNRLGGGLVIYAEDPSTNLATLGIPGVEKGPRDIMRSWGIMRVLDIASNKMLPAGPTVNLVQNELPRTLGSNRLMNMRKDFSSTWPLQDRFGSKTAHVTLFILVLLAFGILVGPINLFVFAKSGQRHRLFVTTPIISLAASLILVVLILFQDGFGGRGQQLILMEVRPDEGENAAYLNQEQIARTGVLLSTGFTTSEPCHLSQVLLAESRWSRLTPYNNGGNSRYSAKVEDKGLKVTGDWFQSRSEHGHTLDAVRPSRGRIELKSDGGAGAPRITSTFAFPLDEVAYTDEDGNHWWASGVQQGRSTELSPLEKKTFLTWKSEQARLFNSRNQDRIEMTVGRKGHFAAVSKDVPGIETLPSINWQETHALITGSVLTD